MKKFVTLYALLVLFLLAFAFDGKLLTGYIPAGADDCLFYYPFFSLFRLKPFPLWNPFEFGGMSLVGNLQYAMFYPLQILFLFFPVGQVYGIHGFLHYLIASVTAFFCFRVMGLSMWASLFGAIIFGQGSFIQGRISNPTLFYSCVWFPLILATAVKAFDDPSPRYTVACGAALALLAFTGSPHNIFYSHLLVFLYVVYRLFSKGITAKPESALAEGVLLTSGRLLGRYVIVLLVFFGIYAVAFFPSMQLAAETIRTSASFRDVANDPVALSWLGNLFVGGTGVPEYTDKSTYCGVIALGIILLSLIMIRDRRMLFFLLVAIISVLIALGANGGIYYALYQLPFTRTLIGPARSLILFVLALSALGAIAFENLIHRAAHLREAGFRRMLALAALVAVIGFAVGFVLFDPQLFRSAIFFPKWTPPPVFVPLNAALFVFLLAALLLLYSFRKIGTSTLCVLLLALLVVDLYHFRQRIFIYYRQTDYFETPRTVEFLREQNNEKFRVLGYIPSQLHVADINNERIVAALGGKLPDLYRVEAVQGFDPLVLRRYVALMKELGGGLLSVNDPFRTAELADPYRKFTNLLNVKYIIGDPNEFRVDHLPFLVVTEPITIEVPRTEPVVGIGFISLLDYSLAIPQGTQVAEVRVIDTNGRERMFPVRAGIETADLRAAQPGTDSAHMPIFLAMNFRAFRQGVEATLYNYYSTINFGEPLVLQRLVFAPTLAGSSRTPGCFWAVMTVTLFRQPDPQRFRKVLDNRYLSVYENVRVMPRAWLARTVRVVHQSDLIPSAMNATDVDLREVAFLEEDPGLPEALAADGEVTIRDYTPNKILLEARVSEPGFLVLSEVFDPGWRVYVNGREERIFRTDYCLRGVKLDPGSNTVYFKYLPRTFVLGAIISGASIAFVVIYFMLQLLFGRRRGLKSPLADHHS